MRKWIPPLLIITATAASIVFYSELPERIPTHWNVAGRVDGWSSRIWGAWMLPLVMAVMWVVLRAVPHVDPRKENYGKFRGAYEVLVIAILSFMLGMHLLVLSSAMGANLPVGRIVPAAVGVFLVIIGLVLRRAHPNWFIGIRTPWTLSSDVAWRRTHDAGGLMLAAAGALTVLMTVVAPGIALATLIGAGVAVALFVVIYSYIVWKRDKDGRPPDQR